MSSNHLTDMRPLLAPHSGQNGLTATTLKMIAIVAMIIDHIAWAFVPTASVLGIVMHGIGRITGPTMFYFIAEGYRYTRDKNRYTLRLGIFALLSWLPFFYFEYGTLPSVQKFSPVGVIFTLFLAHLAIRARHELESKLLQGLVIFGALALSSIGDWGVIGVAITLIFDVYYGNFKKQAIAYSGVIVFITFGPLAWLLSAGGEIGQVLGMDAAAALAEITASTLIQLCQLLPLGLLRFYDGELGRGGAGVKWFFYIVYPVHLLIIGFLRFVIFA